MSEPTLQRLYGDELTRLLSRAVGARHVNRRTTRWMRAETWRSPGATYRPSGPGRTWRWSDLHLHHGNIMRHCDRPFESVEAMDSALLSAWEATVNLNDTIICGGDVALAGALDQVLLGRLEAMPGRKVLVIGNHDIGPTGKPAETASDEASMTLVIAGEPTLLVTHIPLWNVPAGRVNVHGPRPQQRGPAPRTLRQHLRRAHRLPPSAPRGGPQAGQAAARGPATAGKNHHRGDRAPRRRPDYGWGVTGLRPLGSEETALTGALKDSSVEASDCLRDRLVRHAELDGDQVIDPALGPQGGRGKSKLKLPRFRGHLS